jgi:DinB superfamily
MPGMSPAKSASARPQPTEYASYYEKYVALVPGNDIVSILEAQRLQMIQLFAARSERDGNFRYAPDKWTVKEVLGHISDTERIFAYRALRIARADQTPLSGFEQDDYVRAGGFGERTLADLAEEFADVRSATVALFRPLGEEAWSRRGTANKNEVTVRALAFIIAGHELHHREILQERYFPAIPRA